MSRMYLANLLLFGLELSLCYFADAEILFTLL